MDKCIKCGGKRLKSSLASNRIEISGITFTGEVAAMECVKCGERYTRLDDVGGFELAVAERLASLGVRTGTAFKFMRKALGLRAVDLAELLDVAAETVSRWETSEPEAHVFALLGSIVTDRIEGRDTTIKRLRAIYSTRRKPMRIRVRAA
jgi:DNA-binding XRE family transcriptional regulator